MKQFQHLDAVSCPALATSSSMPVTFPTLVSRRVITGQSVLLWPLSVIGRLQGYSTQNSSGFTRHRARAMQHQQQLQEEALHILDNVYGPWVENWRPAAFERAASRYLWTDAFGVCAYLSLYHATKQDRLLQQALALVDDVHNTLGHERPHTANASGSSGGGGAWLQGADKEHPTRAGLRIGKPHPEGHPDGDGQYYHYLTKWAFALNQVAAATHEPKYLQWAIELMQTAHRAFTYKTSSGSKRMYWKKTIDLSHPSVSSMGNLDPYDGLVTLTLLQQAAAKTLPHPAAAGGQGLDVESRDQAAGSSRVLQAEVEELQAMVEERYRSYHSDDPLDLGEALWLSHWQLGPADHTVPHPQQQLLLQDTAATATGGAAWARHVSAVSLSSLGQLWDGGYFDQPLRWRLGFREFGTSIGLQALLAVRPQLRDADVWRQRVQEVHDTWREQLYTRDRDITPVMYATSLVPGVWICQQ